VIFDTVRQRLDKFEAGPPKAQAAEAETREEARSYNSQEDYFPVFGSCVRDLQTLEALVVINITAFYTYMKAVRDAERAFTNAEQPFIEASPMQADDREKKEIAWREALRNVIFVLYLGMESARHAIDDLVEFEPEKAERTIVVLLSELTAYGFLCKQFKNENVYFRRLILRCKDYSQLVPQLIGDVERGVDPLWGPAQQLLPELMKRYEDANFGTLTQRYEATIGPIGR
jgi:hypothetical protein